MTWYADEVITLGTAEVVRAVREDPLLAPFAHHVKNPLRHHWHTPEVTHALPEAGLVVVRPVCDASMDDGAAEWFGEPVLDWARFPDRSRRSPRVERERVANECSHDSTILPPAALLAHLESLAVSARAPFVFYSCCMFGGDAEIELAWVLGPSEEAVFASRNPEVPGERRPVAVLEPDEPTRVVTGDVLVLALTHLGLELPTPYFALHTRNFPWREHE